MNRLLGANLNGAVHHCRAGSSIYEIDEQLLALCPFLVSIHTRNGLAWFHNEAASGPVGLGIWNTATITDLLSAI